MANSPQPVVTGGSPDPRREHPRTALELEVSLDSDHNFFTGLAENISEGGLFIATHTARPIGERIQVEMSLPGWSQVRATCEVRWLRMYSETSDAPPGMGLRFLELSEGDKHAIAMFVATREPIFWEE